MRIRNTKLVTNTVLILALAVAGMASAYSAGDPPAIAKQCCRDLAKRLNVPAQEVKVVEAKPTVWPDAGLGLPLPDEMNAQVLTPGWRIILEAKFTKYLYCTNSRKFKYGGPLAAWGPSALYLAPPAETDANLNGDLVQISLAGTNPTVVLSGVSEFYPQADGSIFAKQRTSRSGFDLLYLAPGEVNKPQKLMSGFDFAGAIVSPDRKEWAAFVRGRVGGSWILKRTSLGSSDAQPQTYELPDLARPGALVWETERFVARLQIGEQTAWYALDLKNAAAGWQQLNAYSPPQAGSLMLSKSESLGAKVTKVDDKPITEVMKVWFTGDEKPVAKIDGFAYQDLALLQNRYAFLRGQQNDELKAYTVDLNTGEVLLTVAGPARAIQPFAALPHGSPLS